MRQLVLGFALALLTPALYAQAPVFTESVSVGYVMVPFTALGANGAPVTDLQARDVKLLVDGRRVATDMFERAMDAPVSFTILMDASGSMALAGKMEAARAAVSALLDHRRTGDEFALYTFAEGHADEVVPFTTDGDRIRRAMFEIEPYGKTAFFDALATMPEAGALGSNPTRAVILLSDGIDNASRHSRESLAGIFEGSAIPIYPLGLRRTAEQRQVAKTSEELSDTELLELVASLTGGKLHYGTLPEQLSAAVQSLQKDLRAQYLIGFTPTGRGAVKYRRISLELARRAKTVRVRGGYRGTEPPALPTAVTRK
jgi:Ca-activated chloride channel family protein